MSWLASTKSESNCIFCKIVEQKIPSQKVAEDDQFIAIRDVNPQAPTHILVIPKTHIANLGSVQEPSLVSAAFMKACSVAKELDLQNGYRIVVNTGPDGGQTVDHLHIHVIGGRSMRWPPG